MRIYVAGPITGYVDKNEPAFNRAKVRLGALGHEVVTPFEHEDDGTYTYEEYLKMGLRLMLTCDGVCLLPEWHTSTGATLEEHVARKVKMDVRDEAEWIEAGAAR